jgi:DNA-dependent RNA polymerase auxiliary subunit epsilon
LPVNALVHADYSQRGAPIRIAFYSEKIKVSTVREQTDTFILNSQVTEQVTEQVKSFINCLKNKELSTQDAMSLLQLRHRPTFVYNYLQPAVSSGFVEMTQPDSPKSPTQRYRLTAKGKYYLKISRDKA